MAKYSNQQLIELISQTNNMDKEAKAQLIKLLRKDKKYGFVWEDSAESEYDLLKTHLPVLVEDTSKAIKSKDSSSPNQILIEGDNLHALCDLLYTHEGKIDVIYIDPPYNSGATDWRYNNDYVDVNDGYRHSKWLSFIEHRIKIAKMLLKKENSVLIVTIDEKEYLHLGCLLEEMFPSDRIQMISTCIHPGGVARDKEFARSDEYIFFVFVGDAGPQSLELEKDWLFGIESTSREGVHWRALLRSGSNDSRLHSPGCFYPIFVTNDGKRIVSIGDALPIDKDKGNIITPEGQRAIFPIHANGSEGCWQCSPIVLKTLCEKGYVKLGGFTPRGMSINYLAKGEQIKVESGLFKIVGRAEDGSLILDDEGYSPRFIPTTQWVIKSHDALRNGTGLLNNILGPKVFPYPKSLYAVHDALRFFVSDKPNAIILDFFAGSGTTMHATMMLNAEDGGNRQCILVTNNENNICKEVTYERNKRVIQGYSNLKGQFIEGFNNNNLRYFTVDLIERDLSHQGKRKLTINAVDILRIKENCFTEQSMFGSLSLAGKDQLVRYFDEGSNKLLLVFSPRVVPFIVKEIETMPLSKDELCVYIFADGSYPYTEDFKAVIDKVKLTALPYAINHALKYVLPSAEDKNIDNAELSEAEKEQLISEAIKSEKNEQ